MKHIRLIEVKKLELSLYSFSEEKEIIKHLPYLNYSRIRDLSYDSQSAGVALRISFVNNQSLFRRPQGIRRAVQMVVTSEKTHKEIFVKDFNLLVSKNDYAFTYHAYIPLKDFSPEENYAYGISFYDGSKSIWLGDYQFWMKKAQTESNEKDGKTDSIPAKVNFREKLNSLTGLYKVKKKLSVYESLVIFNKKRLDFDLPLIDAPLHSMFIGSPGTGKTTVAKMIGEMLHEKGLLSKGHVIIKERATLLGQNYNSEAENTIKAIEDAQGGILFIDEAYQLYQSQDSRDPGKFVIETLLTALSDPSKRDWMLILAGYPEEMKKMWEMNPGFKSRIPESNIYHFEDFSETELMEIAENYFLKNKYNLTKEAHKVLSERMKSDMHDRDKSFGNARYVLNLIQTEILPSMAMRIIKEGQNSYRDLCDIKSEDIPAPQSGYSCAKNTYIGFVA